MPDKYACTVAAEARDLTPQRWPREVPDDRARRSVRLFVRAAIEAWQDARLGDDPEPSVRRGVAVGANVNYVHLGTLDRQFASWTPGATQLDVNGFLHEGGMPPHAFHRRHGDTMAAFASKVFGLGGPIVVCDTACAASAFAIGEAFRRLRRGEVDLMLAGAGSGLVSPIGILAFALIGALSSNADPAQAARPFDRDRDGFVMGEAGAAVVLERFEHARRRGAPILAEVAGYGTTANAGSLTDPSPDGLCEAEAMRLAMADGALAPEDIDYIAAHGTSTPKNDRDRDASHPAGLRRARGSAPGVVEQGAHRSHHRRRRRVQRRVHREGDERRRGAADRALPHAGPGVRPRLCAVRWAACAGTGSPRERVRVRRAERGDRAATRVPGVSSVREEWGKEGTVVASAAEILERFQGIVADPRIDPKAVTPGGCDGQCRSAGGGWWRSRR